MQKKSLLSKIKTNRISKFLRNSFSINPIFIDTSKINHNSIVSDSFAWRTDCNFSTIFKFSDIVKIFLGIDNTEAELIFYDLKNKKIKQIYLNKLEISNSIIIDKKLLDGYEGYGHFYVFFKNQNLIEKEKTILSNRCYLGFKKENINESYVHGNTYAYSKSFDYKNDYFNFVNTSIRKNQKYIIQNQFSDFDYTELFFSNPTNKKINFDVDKKKYNLGKYESLIVEIKNIDVIKILSNCYYLRPIVFNYKDKYFDVYHG